MCMVYQIQHYEVKTHVKAGRSEANKYADAARIVSSALEI